MKKSALITGCSGLIGTSLCEKYLSQGYVVFGLDMKENTHIHDKNFTFLKTDLASEESIKEVFSKIDSLDVVINNAAKTDITFKDFHEVTLDDWNKGLAVNLTAPFLIAKLAFPLLKKTRGSIVNIASTRHLMSEPNTVIYSASKGGIISLTHSLAVTFSGEVRVNAISPGWIDDPKKTHSEQDHRQHPAGRVGVPNDIADLSFYLTSEAAGFITGQDFIIDGGMTKKMIYV